MTRFSDALEGDSLHTDIPAMVEWYVENQDTIRIALKATDKLQRKEVSQGMWDAGDESICMGVETVWEYMSAQLIKECEQEK